jgi:ABC-type amino acid transport substrate-binding protein
MQKAIDRPRWRGVGAAACLCVLAMFLVPACATTVDRDLAPDLSRALRVGLATNYPPLAFEEDGEIRGVEVDLARQLGVDLKVKIRIREFPWEGLIAALLAGEIDVIMSGMSVTPERSQVVSFTEPYLRVGQMAVIRTRDIARLATPNALFAHAWRVGFVSGTTGALFAQQTLSLSELVGFKSVDAGVEALRAGRIDYFLHDAPTIWRLTNDPFSAEQGLLGLYTPLTEEYLAWAVRPADEELRQRLNAQIRRWEQNGVLETILSHWIRVRIELKPPGPLVAPDRAPGG